MPDEIRSRGLSLPANWNDGLRSRVARLAIKEVALTGESERRWERNFALLSEYRAREGDCDVPIGHEEQGEKLGEWLGTQRKAWKKHAGRRARPARRWA